MKKDAVDASVNIRDGWAVVSVAGRIDAGSAGTLQETLTPLIDEGQKRIVIDMAGLDYISSSGLRVLLGARKALQKQGGSVALAALTPFVHEVFEISGFLRIFSVYENVEGAMDAQGQTG
ncbi:anti-sigma factor antagonist [Methanofollis aquaemaris]|uniref:Anti-sigma factor antagonist n=1 Tax=Methanofollis aquaemaris TaxID=126734 RepID=A0A8A3S8Q6_9EURY|nr:STAS domain-containing protein [Methanofollis aquaemaris]QSZ68219.1 anti-sigma factor antagonist [Methanofollis aquaemaris]